MGSAAEAGRYVLISQLPNNKVLVFGGETADSSGCDLTHRSAVEYDIATRTVTRVGDLSIGRGRSNAAVLSDGRVLTLGSGNGCTASEDAKQSEIYDPASKIWSRGPVSSNGFGDPNVVPLNDGRILFFGGYWNHSQRSYAEVYNQQGGRFETVGSMATARHGHWGGSAAYGRLNDGKVIVAGGNNASWSAGDQFLNEVETFNPQTNSWSAIAAMNVERDGTAGGILPDGRFLVVGGASSTTQVENSAEVYDPATGRWTRLAARLNVARRDHKVVPLNDGALLIVGGRAQDGSPVPDTEIFDPATQTFTLAGRLNNGRTHFAALKLQDGSVMVAGGHSSDGAYLDSIEIFTPTTQTVATCPTGSSSTDHATYNPLTNAVHIPYLDVSVLGTTAVFQVDLTVLPNTNPMQLELRSATSVR